MNNDNKENPRATGQGSSKLALLASFVAGAFAAWIIITYAVG
jgi:hypothetical protein